DGHGDAGRDQGRPARRRSQGRRLSHLPGVGSRSRPGGTTRGAAQPAADDADARALHGRHVRRPAARPLSPPDRPLRPRPGHGRTRLAGLHGGRLDLPAPLRLGGRPLRHAVHRPDPDLDRADLRDDRLRADVRGARRPRGAGRAGLGRLPPARGGQRQRGDPRGPAQHRDVGLRDRRHARGRPGSPGRGGPVRRLRRPRDGADGPARAQHRLLAAAGDARHRPATTGPSEGRRRGDHRPAADRRARRRRRRDDAPDVDDLRHPGLHPHLVQAAGVRIVVLRPAGDHDRARERRRGDRLRHARRPLRPANGDPRLALAVDPGGPPLLGLHRADRLRHRRADRPPRRVDRAAAAGDGPAADARPGGDGLRGRARARVRDRRAGGPGARRAGRPDRDRRRDAGPGPGRGRHDRPRLAAPVRAAGARARRLDARSVRARPTV
ncbi:MAG: Uncharacterized MFS-type transporter, partial [uncultured Thermomicrobiales bacterium]